MALPSSQSYAGLAGELADYAVVEDPTTDLPAEASNELRCDTAAMTRTIARAYVAIELTGITPAVVDHDAVWGHSEAVKPTVVRTDGGEYQITWPATVTDARGIQHAVNLRQGWVSMERVGYTAYVRRDGPNQFTVQTYTIVGAGLDDVDGIILLVVM